MWGVRPTRRASLRGELKLGDRRALMSATARTALGADLGDRDGDRNAAPIAGVRRALLVTAELSLLRLVPRVSA